MEEYTNTKPLISETLELFDTKQMHYPNVMFPMGGRDLNHFVSKVEMYLKNLDENLGVFEHGPLKNQNKLLSVLSKLD